jgi:hypothetical protein
MSKQSAFCIATTTAQAEEIAGRLSDSSFPSGDISALFADEVAASESAGSDATEPPDDTAASAFLREMFPWLDGLGSLVIPGMRPLIATGPIIAELRAASTRPNAGGLTEALIRMGIPELVAKRYEAKLEQGDILVSIRTKRSTEIARAREIFDHAFAEDICTVTEGSAPSPIESHALNGDHAAARTRSDAGPDHRVLGANR